MHRWTRFSFAGQKNTEERKEGTFDGSCTKNMFMTGMTIIHDNYACQIMSNCDQMNPLNNVQLLVTEKCQIPKSTTKNDQGIHRRNK